MVKKLEKSMKAIKIIILSILMSAMATVSAEIANPKHYWVQVYAFQNNANLEKFLNKNPLTNNFRVNNNGEASQILVGPTNSLKLAKSLRTKMLKQGYKGAFIKSEKRPAVSVNHQEQTKPITQEIAEMPFAEITASEKENIEIQLNALFTEKNPENTAEIIEKIKKMNYYERRDLLSEFFPQEFSSDYEQRYLGVSYRGDFE